MKNNNNLQFKLLTIRRNDKNNLSKRNKLIKNY